MLQNRPKHKSRQDHLPQDTVDRAELRVGYLLLLLLQHYPLKSTRFFFAAASRVSLLLGHTQIWSANQKSKPLQVSLTWRPALHFVARALPARTAQPADRGCVAVIGFNL